MAEKTLEERLSELYEKIDHRDQFFDKDLKTLIDGIRDAREHGGTASVDVTPIVGGYKIVITDSEGVEHVATVKDGGDAYEVYKSTVPEGQSPMTKEEWLETLKGADGQDGAPGANAVNPFKGYYPSGVSMPATGAVGDYLYAPPSDSQSTATATIWHYDSTQTPSPWTDTGINVSAVVGVEFSSGQAVTTVGIDDEPTDGSDNIVKSGGVRNSNASLQSMISYLSSNLNNFFNEINIESSEIGYLNGDNISSNGIISVSTQTGAKVGYFQVEKNSVIRIVSSEPQYNASVRYGFLTEIPTLNKVVNNFVNTLGTETVEDYIIAPQSGYFCFYSLRDNVRITLVDNSKSFSDFWLNTISSKKYFNKAVNATNGNIVSNNNRCCTDFIQLGSIKKIFYTRAVTEGLGLSAGLAFYDTNKNYISGVAEKTQQPLAGYNAEVVEVPENAIYARFTYWKSNNVGIFFVADAERDAIAKILSTKNTSLELDSFVKIFKFEPGIKCKQGNIVTDEDYGYSEKIPVNFGDTVTWSYPGTDVPNRSCAIGIYDANDNFINWLNNTVEYTRVVTLNEQSYQETISYIRASFALEYAKDSYIKVNGVEVWRALPNSDITYDDLILNVPDFASFNDYSIVGKCIGINDPQWLDVGSCYMLPVKAGNVFYVKAINNTTKVDYAFLSSNEMTNPPSFVGMDSVQRYASDADWLQIIIPNGCNYLYFDHTYDTGYDHTPITKSFYGIDNIDSEKLLLGTFNSSYNEINVADKREEFCSLFRGTNEIETFLFFTDPHLTMYNRVLNPGSYSNTNPTTEAYRDKFISTMQKYFNSLPIDNCICGGDWINYCNSYAAACEALGYQDAYMRKLFKNYIPVQGNHDDNPYNWGSGTYSLTQREVNNLMFRENRGEYYSFDGLNTKFYVMNTGLSSSYSMTTYRWTQVDWFANKLLTDNPAHAIILTHLFSNGLPGGASGNYPNWLDGVHDMAKNLVDIAVAFNNRTSITKNGHTYDFTGKTGRVECYIVGHLHVDFIDTFHEIPIIVTTDIQGGAYADRFNYTGHSYTKLPTFDCCVADYDNHRLHAVRVGAAVSRTVNLNVIELSVGNTITLNSIIGEIDTWHAEHPIGSYSGVLSVDSNGVVTALSVGIAGVRAVNGNDDEEYWIIKVS